MSDNIPFDIQMQIIKRVSEVKSLMQFRSVSKPWKAFIDSSHFIKAYGSRHTEPRSCILSYKSDCFDDEPNYICLADDDIKAFKVQKQVFVVSPLLKQYHVADVVGACDGLLCLFGLHIVSQNWMLVIWNPCIGKSCGVVVRNYTSRTQFQNVFGFGVCPVTRDPTVVRVLCADDMPWRVQVFKLSSGVWNVIPSAKLPRQSIKLKNPPTQVFIDRFIYWGAREETFTHDGKSTTNHMVVSFDLITEEFKVVDLPMSLSDKLFVRFSVSELKGSLVVSGYMGGLCYDVWVMEHDSSFRKLFTIRALVFKMVGFSMSGESALIETEKRDGMCTTLSVYDHCSQRIKNLGILGVHDSFFMDSYKESLLLLDHSDSHIYSDDS